MAAYGGIDVLVNNAGIMKLARLEDGDEALIDSQIAINLKGTINTLREAAKRLRDGGRIVNFSTSVIGLKLETYGILRRDQVGRRDADRHPLQGAARPQHHRQRRRAWADCDRPFPRWQVAGTDRAHVQDEPARTARYARGHCRGGRLPRRA
jgi:hypothetical protein